VIENVVEAEEHEDFRAYLVVQRRDGKAHPTTGRNAREPQHGVKNAAAHRAPSL
jgi:hypothetical protein